MVKQCGQLVSRYLKDGSLDRKDGRLDNACPIGRAAPPVLSIEATVATATEGGTAGQFTISRTGSLANALTVALIIGGTATNGVDYTSIPTTVTLPAGQSSVTIPVSAIDDGEGDDGETVILTLDPPVHHSDYYINYENQTATVTIEEADCFPSESLVFWHQADQLTALYENNDPMTSGWPDESGNDHLAEPPTFDDPPTFVTNVQNGLPAVRVASGEYLRYLGDTINIQGTSLTFYAVLNYTLDTPVDEGIFIEFNQNHGGGAYLYVNGEATPTDQVGVYSEVDFDHPLGDGVSGWQVLTWVIDKDEELATLYRNGVQIGTHAFTSQGVNFGPDQINYFSFQGGGQWFIGDVGEILCYSAAHDQETVETACGCLMEKWALDVEEQ